MAIPMFLAMTADEIRNVSVLPNNVAYLGCHFSSKQLSLPDVLPPGSGLILDDRNPIPKVDFAPVTERLWELNPAFILLDFQRPSEENSMVLAAAIAELPCPVAMPPDYGTQLRCPVFLPPIPPHISAEEHLAPWAHREVWLELALDAVQISITKKGSQCNPITHGQPETGAHTDSMLHCHYKISTREDVLDFYCYRTREDISALLHSPLPSNLTCTVGLFRELYE